MTREECIALLIRYANYNGIGIPNLERCKEAMRMAAKLLSQPSLPSNLDEAELKHVEFSDYPPANQEEELMVYNAFKAGAEWMAGQGHTVDGTFHHSCGYPSVIELKTYLREYDGADVIVQIRKKQ